LLRRDTETVHSLPGLNLALVVPVLRRTSDNMIPSTMQRPGASKQKHPMQRITTSTLAECHIDVPWVSHVWWISSPGQKYSSLSPFPRVGLLLKIEWDLIDVLTAGAVYHYIFVPWLTLFPHIQWQTNTLNEREIDLCVIKPIVRDWSECW
jgi:hypothetical protein